MSDELGSDPHLYGGAHDEVRSQRALENEAVRNAIKEHREERKNAAPIETLEARVGKLEKTVNGAIGKGGAKVVVGANGMIIEAGAGGSGFPAGFGPVDDERCLNGFPGIRQVLGTVTRAE